MNEKIKIEKVGSVPQGLFYLENENAKGKKEKLKLISTRKKNKNSRSKINNLDPYKWRRYEEEIGLQFFSVWDSPERDPYKWTVDTIHGNSPVEIPRQCILRFSKQGDTVLDPFVGSGTTLVVCAKLKRKGIGVEINPKIASIAQRNLQTLKLDDPQFNKYLEKQKIQ